MLGSGSNEFGQLGEGEEKKTSWSRIQLPASAAQIAAFGWSSEVVLRVSDGS